MTRDQMLAHLRSADAVAREAAAHGHHPFGSVLVGPDDRVLMRQGNLDTVRHAETELARRAAAAYSPEFLWRCALVTTFEPCAMCAGALLGEYRRAGLWPRRGEDPRAHGRRPAEPHDGPSLAHRAFVRAEEGRGVRPLPRTRDRADGNAPRLLAEVSASRSRC